jgi:hypothetical protein
VNCASERNLVANMVLEFHGASLSSWRRKTTNKVRPAAVVIATRGVSDGKAPVFF